MKPRIIFLGVLVLLLGLLIPGLLSAQIGNIAIATGAQVTVPLGAFLCADTMFANNPGYGTLVYPNPNSICRAVVIPVELLTFSAALEKGIVTLSWLTAAETNNHGFEVQRKTETGGWAAVGFVEGHGSSSEQHAYGFVDPLGDLPAYCCGLRYRLRQIDMDGTFEYSPEVEVSFDPSLTAFALSAPYPNPASGAIAVPFTLPSEATVMLTLYDMRGARVGTVVEDRRYTSGSHVALISTASLSSGRYLLEVRAGGERRTAIIGVMRED